MQMGCLHFSINPQQIIMPVTKADMLGQVSSYFPPNQVYKTKMSDGSMFKVVGQTQHVVVGYYIGWQHLKCTLDKERLLPTPISPDEWFPHWWDVRLARFASHLDRQITQLSKTSNLL